MAIDDVVLNTSAASVAETEYFRFNIALLIFRELKPQKTGEPLLTRSLFTV